MKSSTCRISILINCPGKRLWQVLIGDHRKEYLWTVKMCQVLTSCNDRLPLGGRCSLGECIGFCRKRSVSLFFPVSVSFSCPLPPVLSLPSAQFGLCSNQVLTIPSDSSSLSFHMGETPILLQFLTPPAQACDLVKSPNISIDLIFLNPKLR